MSEETFFRSIYEHIEAPILIVHVDVAGDFVFGGLNPACEKATGLCKEEVVGKRPEAISGLSQASAAALRADCQRCLEANDIIHCREPFVGRGQGIWWLTQLAPVRDVAGKIVRIIGSLANIADLIRVEVALRESESKYRTLIEHIPQKIFAKDRDSVYLSCNENFARDLHSKPDEVPGKTDYDFFPTKLAEKYRADDRRIMQEGKTEEIEEKYVQDGEEVWVQTVKTPILDEKGAAIGTLGAFWDITQRKREEQTLKESENRFRSIFENCNDGIIFFDGKTRKILFGNSAMAELLGCSTEDLAGRSIASLHPSEEWECIEQELQRHVSGELSVTSGVPVVRNDGSIFQADISSSPVTLDGKLYFSAFFRDITEHKQAVEALRESELKYRSLVEQSVLGIMIAQDGRLVYANEVITKKGGYSEGELMALSSEQLMELIHPHDRDAVWNRMLSRLSGRKEPERNECRFIAKDRSVYWADVHTNVIEYLGKPALQLCIVDITERKQAEDALRRSEKEKTILNQIANIFLTIPDEAMYGEVLAVVLAVMRSKFGIFGYIGETGDLILPSLTREIWNECEVSGKSIVFPSDSWGDSLWGRAIREKKAFYADGPFRTPEGHIHIDHFLAVPIIYGQETIGLICVGNKEGGYAEEDKDLLERIARNVSPILYARLQRDIQEQRRMAAEGDLRESEEKYRLLITNADEAIFIIQDEVMKFPNPKTLEMTGYSAGELAEISIIDLVHAADKAPVLQRYIRLREGGRPAEAYPFRIIDKKGKEIWVQLATAPIIWDKKPGILCFLRDVTEEKNLEAQLVQAQKMEAVGRLAGGVAHDFNNMLVVIIGRAELALMDIALANPLHAQLQEIHQAARRSADLTRQLLAFARRQTIAPRVLNLNDTMSGMLKMLRRLIGEDIDLAWRPGAELWPIKIDPGQLNQVLANLCVNASDAITGVGKVAIETHNVELDDAYCAGHAGVVPGQYVMLAVSDSGTGMSKEIVEHLFEPFFTTKEVGKGTGLGLATVYGIVKQNHGFINVHSEPGQGTTFKVYFSRYEGEAAEAVVGRGAETQLGGRETVLVVEDEQAILRLGKMVLQGLGYTVLIAKTPAEAIRLVEGHTGDIHLLLTDVVMPEMNGLDLAERIASLKPGIKCLYMSGYTADIIAHRGVLEEGVHFVQKPFSMKDLAVRVRKVLDQQLANVKRGRVESWFQRL